MATTDTDKPFFSVVIPLHNKAPFIARALESVFAQSFQDFELLVVDDASTDGGIEEVRRLGYDRVRLLHRDRPGPGGYAARNLGIESSRGDWIAFLDADDQWYPNHLESTVDTISRFPDASFVGAGWETRSMLGPVDERYYDRYHGRGCHEISLKTFLECSRLGQRPVWSSVACVRRASLPSTKLFPADLPARRGGDLHAWLLLMCHLKKMVFSDHLGAIYHGDDSNMVTRNAPSSPVLYSRSIYNQLASALTFEERHLLGLYFNHQLGRIWARSTMNKDPYFFLPTRLRWSADPIGCAKLSAISLIPRPLLRRASRLRTKWSMYTTSRRQNSGELGE